MPPGAIQQHDSVYARCDVAADLGEVQVHRLGIGLGQDNGRTNATRWTRPLIAQRRGSRALSAPGVAQAALLADARFILPPEFDWLAACLRRDGISDQCDEILCASWADGSACG
jgi:hypothetical protein